jgi:hypothetical protein
MEEDHATRSEIAWTNAPNASIEQVAAAVEKLEVRKKLAGKMNTCIEVLFSEWGDGDAMDVKKNLFSSSFKEGGGGGGKLVPKYKLTVSEWRNVITHYCEWHGIRSLDDIVKLWHRLVDAFLSVPGFEETTDPTFLVWTYGCMAKFTLEQEKIKKTL